ncbi:PREDICTED: protein STRUBBELIG-RECEPTOR FAMILY 1 [Tarenaya hassleriana]|uniref:protein STRUBBELIG-RECEPTOR FAMILY 1 n=1 Tax=Tarenaya hassleriana TaxID=28532 RepID=UPI00053CA898|nr:PREDICTED: protein STRUBBELIG-RECEPTOR FAMILY 1 [Tarenaya hassleriana]
MGIIFSLGFLLFSLISAPWLSVALTNPDDVAAISGLYLALGSPLLPGWVASGGDPCGEAWQGILCNGSEVQTITLNGANLGGELGHGLDMFTSIEKIDLSNNRIGGSIPSTLPVTLQNLFLSDNKFTGSIPESLSSLKLLADMSLNNNLLSGDIPDVFRDLGGLINLDLSSNNLTGVLPPSMQSLSTLTTLRLQNNQLSGKLDILQDLPLKDLNVENNLFNGPIPDPLLDIPNFKKEGNPFNLTIAPSPGPEPASPKSPPSPVRPFFRQPSTNTSSGRGQTQPRSHGRPPPPRPSSPEVAEKPKSVASTRIVWITIGGVVSFIVLALACLLCFPKSIRRRKDSDSICKAPRESEKLHKVSKDSMVRPKEVERIGGAPKLQGEAERNIQSARAIPSHEIDMSYFDTNLIPPPPPPPPPIIKRVTETDKVPTTAMNDRPSTSVRRFTIASLQQYTNSFSQENLVGSGILGSVYRAELHGGKTLAVKKLDKKASNDQADEEFTRLVNSINRIRHANVVQLVGYSAEHGQQLLIYEYCGNGTLQDLLHSDDDRMKIKLSWSSRVRMALDVAKALEYLHEICDPPVIHRNLKCANILLDDDLNVHVSDCGLAPLISSGSVSQLSGHLLAAYGYRAPEFENGIYTSKCDVYGFGVVMLELLTGRKPYDKNRNRNEQFLVQWAIPQLHDIDALSGMVDPSLNGEYPAKSLSHFADIISRCVQSEPEFRPPMSEVVQDLSDMIRREHRRNGSNGD